MASVWAGDLGTVLAVRMYDLGMSSFTKCLKHASLQHFNVIFLECKLTTLQLSEIGYFSYRLNVLTVQYLSLVTWDIIPSQITTNLTYLCRTSFRRGDYANI